MMAAVLSLGLALLWEESSVWCRRCGCPYRCCMEHWSSQYSARGIWPIPLWRTEFSLCSGGACGTFLGGDADSCGAGDDLVK